MVLRELAAGRRVLTRQTLCGDKNMENGRLLGIPIMAIGLYFFVCATWKRDFVLYRWKVARAKAWYGENFTHIFYQILGIAGFVAGVAKVLCLF